MNFNQPQNPKDFPFIRNINPGEANIFVESPGRINLIGEHTDYNHGFVFPTAIDKKIHFEISKNGCKKTCRIFSETYKSWFWFNLSSISKSPESWENHILGVVHEILKIKNIDQGFDCIIKSDLPAGAGISSSAALECGLATGLNELFQLNFSKLEIVNIARAAENNFVGSNCGIMDQFASVMSKKDHFILLDCLTLEAKFIPADLKSCKILLINSMVSHNLAESEYNIRRSECEHALKIIKHKFPEVKTLRDVDMELLESCKKDLSEKEYIRVLYILQENERVLKAAEAMKNGDLKKLGELMNQSHYGLKDLYEVSCKELDFLVKFSENKDFIYGSRMMGGGFGGCTINIIEESHIADFSAEVKIAYQKEFNITPEIITVVPSKGTSIYQN
ncbi:galactokinase [Gillisia sp. Q332]|uniref:galactokinase n=1 Tax=Gillisia xinjiangensis TaxID=3384765 RepID=UPI0039193917